MLRCFEFFPLVYFAPAFLRPTFLDFVLVLEPSVLPARGQASFFTALPSPPPIDRRSGCILSSSLPSRISNRISTGTRLGLSSPPSFFFFFSLLKSQRKMIEMLSLDVYLLPASVRIGRNSRSSSWNLVAPGARR